MLTLPRRATLCAGAGAVVPPAARKTFAHTAPVSPASAMVGPSYAFVLPSGSAGAYLVTGFSECVDSFFALELFEFAKRFGFFPADLIDTFEPIIQEEARHILLFANWLAWKRRNLPLWRRPWFELRVAAVWVFLGWERIGIARGMDDGAKNAPDNNFALTGSKAVSDADISPAALTMVCLEENDRRFADYEARLLRPTTTPAIARTFCWFNRILRRRIKGVVQ